jgi:hypothetical protein
VNIGKLPQEHGVLSQIFLGSKRRLLRRGALEYSSQTGSLPGRQVGGRPFKFERESENTVYEELLLWF